MQIVRAMTAAPPRSWTRSVAVSNVKHSDARFDRVQIRSDEWFTFGKKYSTQFFLFIFSSSGHQTAVDCITD